MTKDKEELQSAEAIAELFDMTPRRVQQLAKENIIPAVKTRPYRFDLEQAVREYVRYLRDKIQGREEKTAGSAMAEEEKLWAETDLKKYKARMAKLQLEELEGNMHSSEDVEAAVTDLVYAIRSMIMALPGRLAMDAARLTDVNEISEMIRKECCQILKELANHEYDPEQYRRRVRERIGWSTVDGEQQADGED